MILSAVCQHESLCASANRIIMIRYSIILISFALSIALAISQLKYCRMACFIQKVARQVLSTVVHPVLAASAKYLSVTVQTIVEMVKTRLAVVSSLQDVFQVSTGSF